MTFATGPRLLDASQRINSTTSSGAAARAVAGEQAPATAVARAVTNVSATRTTPTLTADPTAAQFSWAAPPAAKGSRDLTDLATRFQRAVLDIYQRAKSELGYDARSLLRMVANEGAVVTATKLVMSDHLSEGFTFLWSQDRLDLTVEALVINPEYTALFPTEVLKHAEGVSAPTAGNGSRAGSRSVMIWKSSPAPRGPAWRRARRLAATRSGGPYAAARAAHPGPPPATHRSRRIRADCRPGRRGYVFRGGGTALASACRTVRRCT